MRLHWQARSGSAVRSRRIPPPQNRMGMSGNTGTNKEKTLRNMLRKQLTPQLFLTSRIQHPPSLSPLPGKFQSSPPLRNRSQWQQWQLSRPPRLTRCLLR